MRLDWSDIDFVEKRIRVSGDTSKGGALRFVPMSENLVHWLLPHRRNRGPIAPTNYQGKRLRARQAAQVRAIHDGARHSFGTYHCLINGADSTRDVMGHEESSRTLEKHYRSASATVEQAEAFWSISPKEDCVIELKVAL